MFTRTYSCMAVASAVLLSACATVEQSRSVQTTQVSSAQVVAPKGPRAAVAIGKFDNRSEYLRGMFTDGPDRLGAQAKAILQSHLQQSQRFSVMDRENLAEARQEATFKSSELAVKGADLLISGSVSEIGRKDVGDKQLFGLLGRGKTQVAYAKVTLNVVNSKTAEVVYSVQGAGEYSLSEREVLGFGSTASYDVTLNGKVLDLAVRESVEKLVAALDNGAWKAPAQ